MDSKTRNKSRALWAAGEVRILPPCSAQTPPTILHPALGSTAAVGAGQEENHAGDQKAGTPLTGRLSEVSGDTLLHLPVPKGGL